MLPPFAREQLGIRDQAGFAAHFGISEDTLTRWKQRPDFEAKVDKIRNAWALERMGGIYEAIFKSAVKGNAKSQRLWLQVFKEFPAKGKGDVQQPEITQDDIRFLIGELPEEKREKYNIFLRDLLADVATMEKDLDSEIVDVRV
jgi:hypothetical protein